MSFEHKFGNTRPSLKSWLCLAALICLPFLVFAQQPKNQKRAILNGNTSSPTAGQVQAPTGATSDGTVHLEGVVARDYSDDSLRVMIYRLDSSRGIGMDSSISDFSTVALVSPLDITLGNSGAASHSLLYLPPLRVGFDPGFHAYDAYKWRLEDIAFNTTNKPYTELGYMLGGRSEQIINVYHTQNLRPNFNFALGYRLINSPGFFRNQQTNHNNYLFNSWYKSKNLRYNNYIVILANQLKAAENGGMQSSSDLDSVLYAADRALIPTKLGGSPSFSRDFFSTNINTGNIYKEVNFFLRQQYDLGRKDSVVTDSTVIPLFYPRVRFEHSIRYSIFSNMYRDLKQASGTSSNSPDSAYYKNNYNYAVPANDSIYIRDRWTELNNDFSIYQFPDANNLQQFIKLGLETQLLSGSFFNIVEKGTAHLFNTIGHAEYRNRTKNQKWDMLAAGRLYLVGYNIGDYRAMATLQRSFGPKLGIITLGGENANRSPAFNYDERSAFYFDIPKSFNKENTTHLFAHVYNPKLQLQLGADLYTIANYLYLKNYRELEQEGTLFNVLRISGLKTFDIGRRFKWYAEVYLQQKTGAADINLPAFLTRNRIAYEGNLGFRKLHLATGFELRYYSPYYADNYSPLLGTFFFQDQERISPLPDVNYYVNLRIRTFRLYARAENLNTLRSLGGLKFNNNNLVAPTYASPGLNIRIGIHWGFVN